MGSTFPAQSSYEARAVSLGRDVIAGFTMACVSIPQIIAYSDMAGFPGSRGLLTAGPAMMVFGVFTGHPWLSQGVTSASAIMAKEDLHGDEFVKLHGTQSYADLMSLYTVLIGMASVAIALSGFANIVKRIPRPAFIGFAWGARFTVLSNQLPEMLFARGRSFSAMVCKDAVLMVPSYMNGAKRAATLACSLAHPSLWESSTLAFASAATLALILGKHFIPARFPKGAEILAVLVSATLVSTLCRYGDWGNVVGAIPLKNRGFTRTFAAPFQVNLNLPYDEIPGKACQALFFAVINFTSTVSICATYEASGQPWDPRRELLAQGASCIAAGFTGSPPFAASFSRSEVQRKLGARSGFASFVNGAVLTFLLPAAVLLTNAPKAVLASIVVFSVAPKVLYPTDLLNLSGVDAIGGWITALAVTLCTPTVGMLAGTAVSLVLQNTQGLLRPASAQGTGTPAARRGNGSAV